MVYYYVTGCELEFGKNSLVAGALQLFFEYGVVALQVFLALFCDGVDFSGSAAFLLFLAR